MGWLIGDRVRIVSGSHYGSSGELVRVTDETCWVFDKDLQRGFEVMSTEIQCKNELPKNIHISLFEEYNISDIVIFYHCIIGLIVHIDKTHLTVLTKKGTPTTPDLCKSTLHKNEWYLIQNTSIKKCLVFA